MPRTGLRILGYLSILGAILLVFRLGGWDMEFFRSSHKKPIAMDDPSASGPLQDEDIQVGADIDPFPESLRDSLGRLFIDDVLGDELARMDVSILRGGWVALPRQVCLGGARFWVEMPDGRVLAIEEGISGEEDPVGLWKISGESAPRSPVLMTWDPISPLLFISLDADPMLSLIASPPDCQEAAYHVSRCGPMEIPSSPGMLSQADQIVGWRFGNSIPVAFLWTGPPGTDLIPEIRVDDFYRITFAGGREEALLMALGDADQPDLARLRDLTAAFTLEKKLTEADTPEGLRRKPVAKRMRDILKSLTASGRTREAASLFDGPLLAEMGDIGFVMDLCMALRRDEGVGPALQILESFRGSYDRPDERIDQFHLGLYMEQLDATATSEDPSVIRRAVDGAETWFPGIPAIELYRVTAALAERDWLAAEQILDTLDPGDELLERVQNLRFRIEEMRSQSEGIVIRFPPGARQIETLARINGAITQIFVVDTGATQVTLPSAVLSELGLPLDTRLTEKVIHTAGGTILVREIRLEELEIGGHSIPNVTALVMDIPGMPDTGLIGMDVLGRFRMDLDQEKGVLVLRPKVPNGALY